MNKGAAVGFGLLAGMLIGILIAPRPGEETREFISDKVMDIIDQTNDKTAEVVNKVRSKTEDAVA
jgi:gas vesicle protein